MLPSARPICLVFVCLMTAAALCVEQSPAPETPGQARFRSRTDLVALDVSVESRAGAVVPTLTADDFLVLEDNVPQKVTLFSPAGRLPLAVALLIDHSQSMTGERLDRAKAATAEFLSTLQPEDLVEVLAFNDDATRLYPLGVDRTAAREATVDLSASGSTGLFDAVLIGLRDLEKAGRATSAEYQEAIVIMSDGEDTASRESFDDVLEDARQSNVAIDALSLRNDKRNRSMPPVHELTQLAFDTGGEAVAVRRITDLVSVCAGIGAGLRHQYRLGYVPTSTLKDGRWRRISIRTTNGDLVARTRAGYYAPRADGSGSN